MTSTDGDARDCGDRVDVPQTPYLRVRCPNCSRLLAEVVPGSVVRVKCSRLKAVIEWPSPARQATGRRENW